MTRKKTAAKPAERRNLTQPPDWWEAFEMQAASDGLTLSQWIGEVCAAACPKRVQEQLSERPPAHRPKLSGD